MEFMLFGERYIFYSHKEVHVIGIKLQKQVSF